MKLPPPRKHRAPALCRGLPVAQTGGPGTRPGRGLRSGNHTASNEMGGSVCIHHGLASRWPNLYRPDSKPKGAGRGASRGVICAHSQIQDQEVGLVRSAFGFRAISAAREVHQALAARMEKQDHHRIQSGLEGCHAFGPLMSDQEVPAQGRDALSYFGRGVVA